METVTFYEFFPNKEDDEKQRSENRSWTNRQLVSVRRNRVPVFYDFLQGRPVFHIKKVLTKSDTNHLSRLVLHHDDVEEHIFKFWDAQKVQMIKGSRVRQPVVIKDIDTGYSEHQLVLRKWSSNNLYVIQSNWIKEFVKRRGLEAGDEIGLSWMPELSCFYFSVLKQNWG